MLVNLTKTCMDTIVQGYTSAIATDLLQLMASRAGLRDSIVQVEMREIKILNGTERLTNIKVVQQVGQRRRS